MNESIREEGGYKESGELLGRRRKLEELEEGGHYLYEELIYFSILLVLV